MARLTALLVGAAVLGTAALAANSPPRTQTAACPTRSFTVSFDPTKQVVVADGAGHRLASASFTAAGISRRCRRLGEPKGFVNAGLGAEFRGRTGFRCAASQPIRIHVNPIRNGTTGGRAGSWLGVGLGVDGRFRTIVSAVLKNKGSRYASRVYRARDYCKLGA
jgi:hypothetical protein